MKTSVIFALVTGAIMMMGGFAASAFTGNPNVAPVIAAAPAATSTTATTKPAQNAASASATAKPAAPSGNASANFRTQAQAILQKIQAKINQGLDTETDLAPELKTLGALLAANKDNKSSDVAQVSYMRAVLYAEIFDDMEKSVALLKEVAANYPGTEPGKMAAETAAELGPRMGASKIRKSLVVGAQFPDFSVKDLAGKPLSLADYKGKVVLVDFWATWCGPCVAEMPNVQAAYAKYHAKGFDIVGISLDDQRPRLDAYIKEEKIPWRQFYDGKRWSNELAVKYGVQSIPSSYLLGPDGRILAVGPRGPALGAAVAKALGSK